MPNSSPALFDCNEAPKQEADSYLFYENSVHDDFPYSLLWWLVYQVLEHEAGKITVQTLEKSSRKLLQEHWLKRAQSKWHHLCQATLCYNFLPHQKASQASSASVRQSSWVHWWEPSNYSRGSKMLSPLICFCKIHKDTCLHTLVSFILCLFLNSCFTI